MAFETMRSHIEADVDFAELTGATAKPSWYFAVSCLVRG
jgi:hypothetical protein